MARGQGNITPEQLMAAAAQLAAAQQQPGRPPFIIYKL